MIRIAILVAVVGALALANVAAAGACAPPPQGELAVTPEPVGVGDTVTITNTDHPDGICLPADEHPVTARVQIWPSDGWKDPRTIAAAVVPDSSGIWSVELVIPKDAPAGSWTVFATCYSDVEASCDEEEPVVPAVQIHYPETRFEVVADEVVTEPAAAVKAAPSFTG